MIEYLYFLNIIWVFKYTMLSDVSIEIDRCVETKSFK